MRTLCVYCDINDPQHQYGALIVYLESYTSFAQAGENTWFINTDKSPAQVRNEIELLAMPSGKRIIIFNVGVDWSSVNLKPETSDWLHNEWRP
jgi:hypothetical protein